MSAGFRDRPLRNAVVAAAVLVAGVGAAAAEDPLLVIGLRHERIPLYDCVKKHKTRDFARKDFRAPWPILTDPATFRPGEQIKVAIDDREYCVSARSVETNAAQAIGKGLVNPFERGGAASGSLKR
jgi:hypothetical protein